MLLTNADGVQYFYCYKVSDFHKGIDSFMKGIEKGYDCLATDIETFCYPKYRPLVHNPGLDPHTGDISTVAICNACSLPIVFDVWVLEKQEGFSWERIAELFRAARYVIAHNAKFEIKWFFKKFGYYPKNFHCTYVLSVLLANATGSKFGRVRRHGLAHVVRDFFNVKITGKGKEQITDWMPRPSGLMESLQLPALDFSLPGYSTWKEKLDYGCGDILYLFKIHDCLWDALSKPFPPSALLTGQQSEDGTYGLGQGRVLEIEMRFLSTAARFEYTGIPVSSYLMNLIANTLEDPDTQEGALNELLGELCEMLGLEYYEDPIVDGYHIPQKSQKALNNAKSLKSLIAKYCDLNSLESAQAQVLNRLLDLFSELDAVQQKRLGVPDNSEEAIFCSEDEAAKYGEIMDLSREKLAANTHIFKTVLRYKALKKMQGFRFQDFINPVTGCIHGTFNQAAAATGRTSIVQPALQTVSGRVKLNITVPEQDFYYLGDT